MKVNYHTHTTRCRHASGTEREYVEAAIASGLKVLGFADHTPYPFPADHAQKMRMSMKELDDYVDTVLKLKVEYGSEIEIHLGLEVEYFPDYFEELCRYLADYPIEYFLLGQHFLGNAGPGDFYCGAATEDPARLTAYCDQVLAGLETGCFTYLAHPDLPNFAGEERIYDMQMRRICRKAREISLPLEINLLGICGNRHYPNERFWKIVGEEGCDVVLGLDAHQLSQFQFEESLGKAENLIEKYQLKRIEELTLKEPLCNVR